MVCLGLAGGQAWNSHQSWAMGAGQGTTGHGLMAESSPARTEERLCSSCPWNTFLPRLSVLPLPLTFILGTQISFFGRLIPEQHLTFSPHPAPLPLAALHSSPRGCKSHFVALLPHSQTVCASFIITSQLSLGYLILTAPNKLVIFLKGDTL